MMPMRIRRKSQPIEKLENLAAPQCCGRSFPRDHAIQITCTSSADTSLCEVVKHVGYRIDDRDQDASVSTSS
ncbi:hypothetical protein EHH60_15955 [Bradyrhizobium sp. RP6]|nr:hypothetical protein EHH60_15955 [Bradyrhizobium sp. RP6]